MNVSGVIELAGVTLLHKTERAVCIRLDGERIWIPRAYLISNRRGSGIRRIWVDASWARRRWPRGVPTRVTWIVGSKP